MDTLFYFILITVAALALVFIFSKMKSGKSEVEDTAPLWPVYERLSFREAMDRTWELFENPCTPDIAELALGKIGCQISADIGGDVPGLMVTFADPANNSGRTLSGVLVEKATVEGNLYLILFPLPADKAQIESEIREVFNITETDTVNFCIWKA
ncbi:MAG: hypothetical protein IJ222_00855 [Bacteroidales bacterium]|nr:hypothetical protein [Bacteroidales bacterium]